MEPGGQRSKKVVLVGGAGRMAQCFARCFEAEGLTCVALDRDDWPRADRFCADAALVLVSVPIAATPQTIARIAGHLRPGTVLCDTTSTKVKACATMRSAYDGPFFGMHPLFAPFAGTSFGARKIAIVEGRGRSACEPWWAILAAAGAQTSFVDAVEHDRAMAIVQGLRHILALAHGQLLRHSQLSVETLLDLATPGYTIELSMVARTHAMAPELCQQLLAGLYEQGALREVLSSFSDSLNAVADELVNPKGVTHERFTASDEWLAGQREGLCSLSESLHQVIHARAK